MISTILARERGTIPSNILDQPDKRVVYYDVPIAPRVPLHVGQEVQIHSLIPCNSLFPEDDHPIPTRYTAHPTGISGTVVAMITADSSNTEFVIRNESPWSEITHAYLAIQHIQGVTVQLSAWQRLLRATISRPIPKIRDIPLENNAVVFRSDTQAPKKTQHDAHRRRETKHRTPVDATHETAVQLGRRGGRGAAAAAERTGESGRGGETE
ncbi:uncharacterized protein TRAVEDRAFT_45424 [Trametes versicolor FP-101664 SS1]|uniref:uncharacterized protein n=1 Tax=Trametes versicolor (strain FP-101664) TaxID=717944 RepID=UPI0004621BB6|nr:uncharacterized protein TRAVEDRAFT_45424 [Trametes versicolor FP-101664 SS1]EIW60174.1 hypothetical protein TRAVEDRAFT_45424 [Trametes versicolor FP-101664 SS1]